MKSKLTFFFFFFFFCISFVNSVNVNVEINETSNVVKLLNGQYSLVADGVIRIYNPSIVSRVYEFEFPLKLDSLIGINKVLLNDVKTPYTVFDNITNSTVTLYNTTVFYKSEKFDFSYGKIQGYIIEPNETIAVGYHIFGLIDYDIYSKLGNSQTILDYYLDSYNFRSNLILNLQKPQTEGFEYNLDGTLNSSPASGSNNTRLISSEIRNPTDFACKINELKIYRTDVSDPFFQNGEVIRTENNLSLAPFDLVLVDFFDRFSTQSSVYWVSADTIIINNLTQNPKRDFKIQPKPSTGGKGGSGGGTYKPVEKDDYSILVKKEADKTIISNGEDFKVILRVVNVNDEVISNLELVDEIPSDYEIKDISDSVKIENGVLKFNIENMSAYDTKMVTYTLATKKDNFKGITYLKPAKVTFENKEFYSEGVLLINDLLPSEKLFVQKEVKYLDEDYAKVIIKIKNLGNYELENLLVSEIISDSALIKDISKVFYDEKGTWLIKSLKSGEEWEVSYVISRDAKLDTLPNIFGVDKSQVYGTIISSPELITFYKEEPSVVEKVGMGLAIGFLVLYLLF